jgi:hypothetical protein
MKSPVAPTRIGQLIGSEVIRVSLSLSFIHDGDGASCGAL